MKKRIVAGIAVFVFVSLALFLCVAPAQPKSGSQSWTNGISLKTRGSFYFGKGQWLADLRTVASCIRFLCGSRIASLTHLVEATPVVPTNSLQLSLSTNDLAVDEVQTVRFVGRRLSRLERMNGRYEWSGICGLPPRFAVADFSWSVPGAYSFSSLSVTSGVPQRWTRPAQSNPPASGHSSGGITATNLEGA